MSVSVLVGITPPQEVAERIWKIRDEAASITKENFYKKSDPHITVFVNTYSELQPVEEKVKTILESFGPFEASCIGIESFGYDAVTKMHTLVYRIESSPEIVLLQKEIVKELNPLRTADLARRIIEMNPNLNKEQMDNLKKYGYPYSPDEWKFHSTIGSFPQESFDEILDLAMGHDIKKNWTVESIDLYKKTGKGTHQFYKKINL